MRWRGILTWWLATGILFYGMSLVNLALAIILAGSLLLVLALMLLLADLGERKRIFDNIELSGEILMSEPKPKNPTKYRGGRDKTH